MAAFTAVVAAIGAGIAAAGTTHTIEQGKQAKREANRAEKNAKLDANKQEAALDDQKKKEEAMATRDQMRAKQKALSANAEGRDSTILTEGASGTTSLGASPSGKSVLGA